jgi:hypothetical protein
MPGGRAVDQWDGVPLSHTRSCLGNSLNMTQRLSTLHSYWDSVKQ